MNASSTFSRGKGHSSDNSSNSTASKPNAGCGGCCNIDIRIDAHGDVNIYNCSISAGTVTTSPPSCESGFSSVGTCLPAVPGAKHKLSREQRLNKLADGVRAPSSLAAGAMLLARQFLLGKTPANAVASAVFASLGQLPRGLLSCPVAAFILFRNI
jgi:hypothetical protein